MKKILFLCLSTTAFLNSAYTADTPDADIIFSNREPATTPIDSINSVTFGHTEFQGYGYYSAPIDYQQTEPQGYGYFAGTPFIEHQAEFQGYGYSAPIGYHQPESQGDEHSTETPLTDEELQIILDKSADRGLQLSEKFNNNPKRDLALKTDRFYTFKENLLFFSYLNEINTLLERQKPEQARELIKELTHLSCHLDDEYYMSILEAYIERIMYFRYEFQYDSNIKQSQCKTSQSLESDISQLVSDYLGTTLNLSPLFQKLYPNKIHLSSHIFDYIPLFISREKDFNQDLLQFFQPYFIHREPFLKILHALKYADRKTDHLLQSNPYSLHNIVTGEIIDPKKIKEYKEYIYLEKLYNFCLSSISEYAQKKRFNNEQVSKNIEEIYLDQSHQHPYPHASNLTISDIKKIIKSIHIDQIEWGEHEHSWSIDVEKVIHIHEHLLDQFKKGDIIDYAAYTLLKLLTDQISLHPSIEELPQFKKKIPSASQFNTPNTLSYLIHPRFAIIDDSTLQKLQVFKNLAPLVLGEHEYTDEELLPEPIKEKVQKITKKYHQVLLNAFHEQKIQLLYIHETPPQFLYNSECQNLVYEAIEDLIANNDPSLYDYYISFLWGANFVNIRSLNQTVFFELPRYTDSSDFSINPQDFINLFEEHFQDTDYPTPYVLTPSSKDIQKLSTLTEDQKQILKIIDTTVKGCRLTSYPNWSYNANSFVAFAEIYETPKEIYANPVLIKAKKFNFSQNIVAHGGYIAVAEEFEFNGGQITHPYLCHFIQVPKGTIILDDSHNISTAAVN